VTLKQFIRDNRTALDEAIGRAVGRVPKMASCYCPLSETDHQHPAPSLNDEERRQWILNDEGLYRWARSEGCRI
jgi:hypothetical protein